MTSKKTVIFAHGGGNNLGTKGLCIKRFLKGRKRVVVLSVGVKRSFPAEIKKMWLSLSGEKTHVSFIVSKKNVSRHELKLIAESDGIFIGGGDTRLYYKLFVAASPVRRAIQAAISAGAHIGGISAGALLLPNRCIVWGSEAREHGRSVKIASPLANSSYRDASSVITYGAGVGVTDIVFDVHGTQWGRLPRLLQALKDLRADAGVCIDEDAFIEMEGKNYKVWGEGRCYQVLRKRGGEYGVSILKGRGRLP